MSICNEFGYYGKPPCVHEEKGGIFKNCCSWMGAQLFESEALGSRKREREGHEEEKP